MFYQTRSNAIILQGTLPALCIVRAERLRNGREIVWKTILVSSSTTEDLFENTISFGVKGKDQGFYSWTSTSWEISFNSHLEKTLQSGSSKPTQSPKPIEDRTGQPVTQEIVGKLQEELSSSDRSGQTR